MSKLEVYFDNHNKALRFPWSIYHKPLLLNLEHFFRTNISTGTKILVIGPGDFQEYSFLNSLGAEISILDIDPRVLKVNEDRHGKDIKNYFLVDQDFNGYPANESFDLIYAKEVIEHLINYSAFLEKNYNVLKPQGKIWLSTPNYGFFLLPLLESTVLELVARISGFSRRDIHPSRFSKTKLGQVIAASGFKNIKTTVTFMKLALTVVGQKI